MASLGHIIHSNTYQPHVMHAPYRSKSLENGCWYTYLIFEVRLLDVVHYLPINEISVHHIEVGNMCVLNNYKHLYTLS